MRLVFDTFLTVEFLLERTRTTLVTKSIQLAVQTENDNKGEIDFEYNFPIGVGASLPVFKKRKYCAVQRRWRSLFGVKGC